MSKKRNNFRLGLTIIIMGSLFVACLIFIGSGAMFKPQTREFVVRFTAGSGMPEIVAGSKVTCFGQTVGKVTETSFESETNGDDSRLPDHQFLEVRATALATLNLRADCIIIGAAPPLGGTGHLEIVDRGMSQTPLSADRPIDGKIAGLATALTRITSELDDNNPNGLLTVVKQHFDTTNEDSLLSGIHRVVDNIDRMTASLAMEVSRETDKTLLAKVHASLEKIETTLTEVNDLVKHNRPAIDNSLTSLEHALNTADTKVINSLADELNKENEASILAQAHQAFDKLNKSLDNIKAVSGDAKTLVAVNSGQINELVENAVQASVILRTGIKDLTLHPWKLLAKPGKAEKKELELFEAAREFTLAAAHLDDSTTRLQALLNSGDGQLATDDEELLKVRKDLEDSVKKYFEIENILWEKLNQ